MQLSLTLLALAASAASIPTAVLRRDATAVDARGVAPCTTQRSVTVESETESQDPPVLVTGFQCTSLTNDGCSLAKSATYTKTVSVSFSGGFSGTLELSKILSMGADAGFGYSWATSDAQGSTASVNCPKGGFVCGLQAVTTVITTKGRVKETHAGDACLGGPVDDEYTVVSAKTVPNVPKDQAAIMDFKACMISCASDNCDAAAAGIEKCPGS